MMVKRRIEAREDSPGGLKAFPLSAKDEKEL